MKIEKGQNVLFYIALTIELMILLIDKSAITNSIEGRLFQLTVLLFACKVALTKYTLKEWILIVAFEILGFISYKMTGRNEIIRIVILIAACKGMNMKTVFTYMFYVVLTGCMVLVGLSLTGILGTVSITGVFRGDMVETRYCLGLGHPNALHCMFFMLAILGMYLYGSKMKLYQYAILLVVNGVVFFLTGSKTGMMVTTFAILFAVLLQYGKKLRKTPLFYGFVTLELTGCAGIAWLAAKYSELIPYHDNWRKFDRLLSDRIVNLFYDSASHAGTLATWTWWGVTENEYYFDLGWVRLFYWYGIIPASIYVVILFLLIRTVYKEKDYMGLMVLASLFLYTLVEAHIVSVYLARDYTLFLLGTYWTKMFRTDAEEAVHLWNVPAMILKKAE